MKRKGNLYTGICSIDNLMRADGKASQGKKKQKEIRRYQANGERNIAALHEMLVNKTYKTSPYHVFKIYEPKERDISKVAYRDRIVHHAIMNYLEGLFVPMFTADVYNCIKGRGIHKAGRAIERALNDEGRTTYCLKIDIRKFYPNVNHEVLKQQLRRKIKDNDLLWLLDEIIDSAPGLPIGNYLSQYLANFYLTGLDHWLKEVKKVKYYFRYADDMVFLSDNKDYLHGLLAEIREYLEAHLKLALKPNYQVFPVAARGIDVIGYVFYHTHTLIRKGIKQRCCRMLKKRKNPASIASYRGWMKHANCRNLEKKLNMQTFKDLKIQRTAQQGFIGNKIKMHQLLNRPIVVHSYKIEKSKFEGKGDCLHMQVEVDNAKRVVFASGVNLMHDMRQMREENFPFQTTIVKDNERYEFT